MKRNVKREYGRAYAKRHPERVKASRRKWYAKMRAAKGYAGPWTCPDCQKTVKANGKGGHMAICGPRREATFWAKVDKSAGLEACWPWTGSVSTHGYGTLHMLGRYWGAHKAAYFFGNGPIPDGLQVRHTCDNRICCNPTHLLTGTIQDNMDDKKARGRSPKTMRKFLTAEQVRDIRAARGTLSSGDIAKKYGITQSYAFTIWAGKVWRNV